MTWPNFHQTKESHWNLPPIPTQRRYQPWLAMSSISYSESHRRWSRRTSCHHHVPLHTIPYSSVWQRNSFQSQMTPLQSKDTIPPRFPYSLYQKRCTCHPKTCKSCTKINHPVLPSTRYLWDYHSSNLYVDTNDTVYEIHPLSCNREYHHLCPRVDHQFPREHHHHSLLLVRHPHQFVDCARAFRTFHRRKSPQRRQCNFVTDLA
mmetsp:Transcript_29611/g.46498  ORF Transcript_29611/g.46498 Transcript_29611/m.46498 type:complete len:205 (-) Transcript_29611:1614-2228(-)